MKQKEFEIYSNLLNIMVEIRNTCLRESNDKNVMHFDKFYQALLDLDYFDIDKKAKELTRGGITHLTPIIIKKSCLTKKTLPKKATIGHCFFVEDIARYFVRGKSHWIYLPTYYLPDQKNGTIIKEFLQ